MNKQLNYQKPTINVKKVKVNFFMKSSRFLDSFDNLLVPKVFAQYGGGGGGCFPPPNWTY